MRKLKRLCEGNFKTIQLYGCLFLRSYQAPFQLYLASHWGTWEHSECPQKNHDLVMEGLVKHTQTIWF